MRFVKLEKPIYQAIPLSPDDHLQIVCGAVTAPITIRIEGTALNSRNELVPFNHEFIVAASVTKTARQFRLGYSFLLSVVAYVSTGTVFDGDCYAQLNLVQDQTSGYYPVRKTLAQGYIGSQLSISYGSGTNFTGNPLHAYLVNIPIADPAVNTAVSYACPDFTCLKIVSITITAVADATVANRQLQVAFTYPGAVPHNYKINVAHTAAANYNYVLCNGNTQVTGITANSFSGNIPNINFMPPGVITCTLLNSQAGDQLSDFSILAERSSILY